MGRKPAAQCEAEGVDHPGYLLHLADLELIDRHQCMVQRRTSAARFPADKSLDTFDFLAIHSVNKPLVMQLARCEYVRRRENVAAIGNSSTGKTHVALGLGLAACHRGALSALDRMYARLGLMQTVCPPSPVLEGNTVHGGVASPRSSLPQQAAEPSVFTPQVWVFPALTERKEPSGDEAWPSASLPQQATEPSVLMPQV